MGKENNPLMATDLNPNWPLPTDQINETRVHLTNIKKVMLNELALIKQRLLTLEQKEA